MHILSSAGPRRDTIELEGLEPWVLEPLEPDDIALLALAKIGLRPEPDMGFLGASTHEIGDI